MSGFNTYSIKLAAQKKYITEQSYRSHRNTFKLQGGGETDNIPMKTAANNSMGKLSE